MIDVWQDIDLAPAAEIGQARSIALADVRASLISNLYDACLVLPARDQMLKLEE